MDAVGIERRHRVATRLLVLVGDRAKPEHLGGDPAAPDAAERQRGLGARRAKERGIMVEETTREGECDYESLITVTVVTERQARSVSGTVFADSRPRIVNVKGIRMDAEFGPSMLYITNQDKPGFIGRFASMLGDAGINIATFHVGRDAPGANAIALIEVDGEVPPGVLRKVQALPLVQQAKPLRF
jgi:D-3-phosphoglycerate dehydrogenase / 2-oxoglutarate reductase